MTEAKDILESFTKMLKADEPIQCSDPDCREIHLSDVFQYDVDGRALKIRATWSQENGRYYIFRED